MAEKVNGRVAFADLLRVFAALAVVVLHVSCSQMYRVSIDSGAWAVFNVYDGLVRWCVPVFVMLSGMFLLDVKRSLPLPKLLFHNMLHVLIALLFWGVAYGVAVFWLEQDYLSLAAVGSVIWSVVTGHTHYHLWFLYLILGLYLVTPILRAFVRGAKRSDFHWFFLLSFVFASLLPTLFRLWPNATAIIQPWYYQLKIQLVMGYVGLYVAGYYLKEYTLGRLAEAIIYVVGILSAAITIGGTRALSLAQNTLVDVLYDFLSPNVVLFSVAVVVLFRYVLGISTERSRRQHVGGLAKLAFGAFLVHDFFLIFLRGINLTTLSFNPIISIPVLSLLVFFCSLAVAWLISKIPLVGRWII